MPDKAASRHYVKLTRDDSLAAAARVAHALACGCAADDWCDVAWLVAIEQAVAAFHTAEAARARTDLDRFFHAR